jgi:predicted nucleic acid-binding protein
MLYLDTSALVKLYVDEEEGVELVHQAVREAEGIATSTIAYAEARASLARKQREGTFSSDELRGVVSDLDDDWPNYTRLDTANFVSLRAGKLAELHELRGFDSIHLASALRPSEMFEDLRFLAFDSRLTTAARNASLNLYEKPNSI